MYTFAYNSKAWIVDAAHSASVSRLMPLECIRILHMRASTGVLVSARRVCGMLQANQCENTLRLRTAIIISADMPRVRSAERIHKTEIDLFVFMPFLHWLLSPALTPFQSAEKCYYFDCYRRQW